MCADDRARRRARRREPRAPRRSRDARRPSRSSAARDARGRKRRPRAAVPVDRAHDREADLVAGRPHDDRVEGEVERAEAVVVVVGAPPSARSFSASAASSLVAQPRRRRARHLALEHAPHRDQVVEQRHVVVVLERDPEHDGVEQVPRVARLDRRARGPARRARARAPRAASAPRGSTVRLKPNSLAERRLGRQDVAFPPVAADDLARQLVDDDGREPPGPLRPLAVPREEGLPGHRLRCRLHPNIIRPTAAA